MHIRIAEAARRLGLHPTTLRSLERKGMIKVRRDWAGHRIYSEEELKEIEKELFGPGAIGGDADGKIRGTF